MPIKCVNCHYCGKQLPVDVPEGTTDLDGPVTVHRGVNVEGRKISFTKGGMVSFGAGGKISFGGPPTKGELTCPFCHMTDSYNISEFSKCS